MIYLRRVELSGNEILNPVVDINANDRFERAKKILETIKNEKGTLNLHD